MIKKGLILIIVFLFLIPTILAQTNPDSTKTFVSYNESGNKDNLYQLGLGTFNSLLSPTDVNAQSTTITVDDGKKLPLISDLDNDGRAEIIILDGITIELYQNKTLDFVASHTLNVGATERFSNMITISPASVPEA